MGSLSLEDRRVETRGRSGVVIAGATDVEFEGELVRGWKVLDDK
jgi:hypothetical protein